MRRKLSFWERFKERAYATDRKKRFPDWAWYDKDDLKIIIDADQVYPLILQNLKVDIPTLYWMSVCRRCSANYMRDKVKAPIHVRIIGDKTKWGKEVLLPGEGAEKGAEEFRKYYKQATKDLG